jgi:hypothetical protein
MNVDALRTVIKEELPKQLIEELSPNSSLLRRHHRDFLQVSGNIQILSVFETQKTATVISDVSHRLRTMSPAYYISGHGLDVII